MLRLVRLNLYNYKLYKNMISGYGDFRSEYSKLYLLIDNYENHDFVVKHYIYDEKKKTVDGFTSFTYFLYDTKTNGFIGSALLKFKINATENICKSCYEISPMFINCEYEIQIISLIIQICKEKKVDTLFLNANMHDIEIYETQEKAFMFTKIEEEQFSTELNTKC